MSSSTEQRGTERSGTSPATWAACALLLAIAAALYGPWVASPKIFDDVALYTPRGLAYHATNILDAHPRTFPYFTLALPEILFEGGIVQNRIVGLVLHGLCGIALFLFARRLFRGVLPAADARRADVTAAVLAAVFVAHPVAVYGAGYLAQRTIVFATLFSLLSALWVLKALDGNARWRAVVVAAAFYWAAVYSKEHAITLPPVLAACLFIAAWRQPAAEARRIRARLAVWVALCAPAVVLIYVARRAWVGVEYEPFGAEVIAQLRDLPIMQSERGPWMLSALIQTANLWRYVGAWLWPNPADMAIDLRIDFARLWDTGIPLLAALGMVLLALVGLALLLARSPVRRLLGLSITMTIGLYVTELAAIRFQEPFVLYRSYLWGPWILLAPAALALALKPRTLLVAATPVVVMLAILATGRLAVFSTERSVWEEAGAKLPSATVPGAPRIYYNRGLARARMGDTQLARRDFDLAVQADPMDYQGHYGLALLALRREAPEEALAHLDRALAIRDDNPSVIMDRGVALERLGRLDDAIAMYAQMAKRGDVIAKMRVEMVERKIAAQRGAADDTTVTVAAPGAPSP